MPGPPAPPPPPQQIASSNVARKTAGGDRDALLLSIRRGHCLRPITTVDKSSTASAVGRVLPSARSSSTAIASSSSSCLTAGIRLQLTNSPAATQSAICATVSCNAPPSPHFSPVMRRVTSRASVCSSTSSTRRPAPAIPTSTSATATQGGSCQLRRSVSGRRSRVTIKPTAPPPPPPAHPPACLPPTEQHRASHLDHETSVCRARSMRVHDEDSCGDIAAYCGAEWRQQRRSVSGGSMRLAPLCPPSARPLKPPPPPPRAVTTNVTSSSSVHHCAANVPCNPTSALATTPAAPMAPPVPPVRNSSLSQATDDTVQYAATLTDKIDRTTCPAAQLKPGGVFDRFTGSFRSVTVLPPPSPFSNCVKLYSSKTQLNSSRRSRAPAPPSSSQPVH